MSNNIQLIWSILSPQKLKYFLHLTVRIDYDQVSNRVGSIKNRGQRVEWISISSESQLKVYGVFTRIYMGQSKGRGMLFYQ